MTFWNSLHIKLTKHIDWFGVLIACIWAKPLLNLTAAIAYRIPVINSIGSYVPKILTIIVIILSLPSLKKRIRLQDVLIYFAFIAVYFFQYITHPSTYNQLDEYLIMVCFGTIPVFFIGCSLDIKKYDSLLFKLSVACIILSIYTTFFTANSLSEGEDSYSMFSAYLILPYALYILWHTLRKPNLFNIIFSITSVFLLITFGTRGPFVCLLAFFLLWIIINLNKKYIPIVISFIIVSIIIFMNFERIMIMLESFLDRLGMSSRILSYYFSEQLDDDSGRGLIINILREQLNSGERNFGYGLFGAWQYVGIYAHRLYWDFWFSFGYVIGTLLLVGLFYILFNGFRACQDKSEKEFLILLFCCSIVKLMLSDYYLFDRFFFLLIGLCFALLRKTKTRVLRYSKNALVSNE